LLAIGDLAIARIIQEHFCCNRGFAAATRLRLAGSPLALLDVLFKYAARLRMPVSQRDCAISPRTVLNNAG
jgi:hypothetical protein